MKRKKWKKIKIRLIINKLVGIFKLILLNFIIMLDFYFYFLMFFQKCS